MTLIVVPLQLSCCSHYGTFYESRHVIKDTSKESEEEWETEQKAEKEKRNARRDRGWRNDAIACACKSIKHPEHPSVPKRVMTTWHKSHSN